MKNPRLLYYSTVVLPSTGAARMVHGPTFYKKKGSQVPYCAFFIIIVNVTVYDWPLDIIQVGTYESTAKSRFYYVLEIN